MLKTWVRSELLFRYTIGLILLVYGIGMLVTIMEPDAATYAIISMEMLDRGDWLDITSRGADWLDKPHFQFWVTAVSYKVFGVNNFGFKFPAILFTLLGALYTYRFAAHYYSRMVATFSVIILLCSLHLILSNNDVRAEPYLLGLSMFSLFYLAQYLEARRIRALILGSIGLACLMMTKGLFSIIPVAMAVFFHLLVRKKWKEIFHWQWILTGLLVLLFMAPTLWAYYQQFDLQPEKEIFGQRGVSGIKFFFWDSQWGRFTNTGPIKGAGDPFFFVHSIVWAFAPWAFLGYFGLFRQARALAKGHTVAESYTFFGIVMVVIVFSASKFQLPHYLVPLFPFLSIICAATLEDVITRNNAFKTLNSLHILSIILLMLAAVLLENAFGGRLPHWDTLLVAMVTVVIVAYIYLQSRNRIKRIIFPPAFAMLAVMYYMNRDFYPKLMKYQSESEAAFVATENNFSPDNIICFERSQWITDFYVHRTLSRYGEDDLPNKLEPGQLIYTTDKGLNKLKQRGLAVKVIESLPDFHVTTLSREFIFANTRETTLATMYLVILE